MGMFTASRVQIATYLLGVCPFSIAFLVFLNSSVSFIVTDLIGREHGVGDAVGNLGFADELVALIACPFWGLLSDRIGVRLVCSIGYIIIGIALFVFVQAKNVYPQLLLGRLFFSVGGAAASTMVTAVLPTMSFIDQSSSEIPRRPNGHQPVPSIASEQTITPSNYRTHSQNPTSQASPSNIDSTSKIAGFVGMATGCGALIALSLFLPLPARFQKYGIDPGHALQYSYYIVGAIALVLAVVCLLGLHGLRSEQRKGWSFLLRGDEQSPSKSLFSAISLLYRAFLVGFTRTDVFIGYIGGFVARASSVGISLFVPLLVNATFLSSGLCASEQDHPAGLPDIKRRCPRAYVVAAELTGASQLVALLCAPLFGYWSSRATNKTLPLMFAAAVGIIGYPLFALKFDPHDDEKAERAVAFVAVCFIGISQIGAIVCSLGILTTGILAKAIDSNSISNPSTEQPNIPENEPLLATGEASKSREMNLTELKGSVAGVYSFYGGAAILLLTKVGGALFDSTTTAAPFYMMASFNAILLIATVAASLRGR
ncbi:hypothetical protein H2198_001619 [Neophaeococcomyces mojaviensis]|uniref:Uncharacterized protein n=1 Tax=Neophaeococcomyces mojaviensis TaxID=3383035 RepID=A0ACC3AH54_9EURO|nr:hypothetical protein H2198_001619 [Knufia sp. JES_112]